MKINQCVLGGARRGSLISSGKKPGILGVKDPRCYPKFLYGCVRDPRCNPKSFVAQNKTHA